MSDYIDRLVNNIRLLWSNENEQKLEDNATSISKSPKNYDELIEPKTINTTSIKDSSVKNNSNMNVAHLVSDAQSVKITRKLEEKQYNFCVISGNEYIFKVLALYESIKKYSNEFYLFVCCIDEVTYSIFSKLSLENLILGKSEDFEDNKLKKVKKSRKTNEYCWTLKAPLMEYLLESYNLPSIIYLDGDLFFFSSPEPIFKEWGEKSIYLCPQRDLDWVEEKYGKFQAGLVGFKNDHNGREALKWWREKCIEWCFKESSQNRFGDQKYLDDLARFFPKVKISSHLGVDAAPWNTIYNNDYEITKKEDRPYIENDPLIVFHFACLSIYNFSEFDLWSLNNLKIDTKIINYIYVPYLEAIRRKINELSKIDNLDIEQGLQKGHSSNAKTFYKYSKLRREMDQWDTFMNFTVIMSKEYVIKGLALYESIFKKMRNFHMWILTIDKTTHQLLSKMNWPNVTLIQLEEIEDEQLLKVKNERAIHEYCWTLKAPLCQYVLNHYKELDHIIYCDTDIYFFNDPLELMNEWGSYSIFLSKQNGTMDLEKTHGQYQAGLIGFKRDNSAAVILDWWKEKCIDHCSDVYNSHYDSWGDQKYLESIPKLFSNIKIIDNNGINVAPWNLVMKGEHTVLNKSGKLTIDENLLFSYHFGSMLMINKDHYDLWKLEKLAFSEEVINYIYLPYIHHLKTISLKLQAITGTSNLTPFLAPVSSKYTAKNPLDVSEIRFK
ncbi:putative nucleotide-diphospho-sugar transferase [Metabacillus litoralis]|uniref:putative nucleotide-diphospho-sugar transferase n=1 Tax=Metabacillus litoralis TaxID=152268 RepID=UPI001CFED16F|nr:putative nucleotide-diphospho-sugar transferase [Metabacillus litoralis]